MKKIYIIGIGMGNPNTITLEGQKIISLAKGLIGAGRMVEAFASADVITAKAVDPVDICKWIREHEDLETIAVLMSGDVGFFSGAKKLSKYLENEGYEINLIAGISSLQYLCANIKTSWEDAKILSLHHKEHNFLGAVQGNEKVFMLTGGDRTPDKICDSLTKVGLGQVNVYIGERLSYPEERIIQGRAEDLAKGQYDSLSVMLVVNENYTEREIQTHGLVDEEFIRGQVPMTKQEIRSIAISKLGISKGDIIYDVGAGTGSISVEMALQAYEGRVYAIEVNSEALGLIGQNREKFKLYNMEIVPGAAPEAMEELPPPNKVFVGGTKGKVYEILRDIQRKAPDAVVVVDAIAIESVAGAIEALKANGFTKLDISQVFVARGKSVGQYNMLMGQNPVFIIRGESERDKGTEV